MSGLLRQPGPGPDAAPAPQPGIVLDMPVQPGVVVSHGPVQGNPPFFVETRPERGDVTRLFDVHAMHADAPPCGLQKKAQQGFPSRVPEDRFVPGISASGEQGEPPGVS